MTYVDLGSYTFTTAADYTGFNPGNLTSILDPAAIRVANYELYRLLINTSAVPALAQLPAIVQTAPPVVGTSLTAVDITFSKATTKGNLVVAAVSSASSGTNPSVSAVTLGGSADNWGQIVANTSTQVPNTAIWADPATAEASAAIAVTLSGGSGTGWQNIGMAWEISGALDTASAAGCWDSFAGFTSGPLVTTAQTQNELTSTASDMQIGFGTVDSLNNATPGALIQPQGWTSQYVQPVRVAAGVYMGGAGSWSLTGPAGSSTIYQLGVGGGGPGGYFSLATASFLPSDTAPAATPLPFRVAVDGVTWDSEQTVAGVGYTYTIGQSPLVLKTGATLQIFWDLPAASYLSYASSFQITGWFRYDPSAQP